MIDWPFCSLDPCPIENAWLFVKKKREKQIIITTECSSEHLKFCIMAKCIVRPKKIINLVNLEQFVSLLLFVFFIWTLKRKLTQC